MFCLYQPQVVNHLNTAKLLAEGYKKELVLSSLSAGAICWFKHGFSGFERFAKDQNFGFGLENKYAMEIEGDELRVIPCGGNAFLFNEQKIDQLNIGETYKISHGELKQSSFP